jgi:succinyl-CoA synthetase beta subunit
MRALRERAVKMNLHEYQAKDIFRSYGIAVPAGRVAASADEAVSAA